MATSGTYTFNLPIDELVEEAVKLAGGEPITGGDLKSARRALDLLFTDMQNRGILLHTLRMDELSLAASTTVYDLSANVQDVVEAVVRVSNRDYDVQRVGFGEYIDIPNKGQGGRPTKFFVDRRFTSPRLYFWPVPTTNYVFLHWAVRNVEDSGKMTNDPEMPRRFWPALVWGLAYQLAARRGLKVPETRLAFLKAEYEEKLSLALEEDMERVSLFIRPTRRRR